MLSKSWWQWRLCCWSWSGSGGISNQDMRGMGSSDHSKSSESNSCKGTQAKTRSNLRHGAVSCQLMLLHCTLSYRLTYSCNYSHSVSLSPSHSESRVKAKERVTIIRVAAKQIAEQINLLLSTGLNVDALCPWQMSCHTPWRLHPRWHWAACVCHDFKNERDRERDSKIMPWSCSIMNL